MAGKLSRKPLLEAIFEFQWAVEDASRPNAVDPDYTFLIGMFRNAVKADFPYTSQLETAQIPLDFAKHIAQYQFRVAEAAWPLVQLGPGVITVNETSSYSWDSHFERHCKDTISRLLSIHPRREQIVPVQAQLRFINAVEIDENLGLLEQIGQNLKTDVALPPEVVRLSSDSSAPVGLSLSVAYPVRRPPSRLVVKMNRGQAAERDALIWEISVLSDRNQMEDFYDNYESWLDTAHSVAEAAFFGFLTDDLLERFGYEPADR